jgi:hypothetical protein
VSTFSHRVTEEGRQIGHFATPLASSNHPHRHVLSIGRNWDNLHAPISGIAGAASQFFAARNIKWWTSPVTGDPKGMQGPTHNLLSSQVACLNVLLPLANDPDALTAMLRLLDPAVVSVVAVCDGHVSSPSLVEFEWVASKGFRSLEGTYATRGQRVTSTDAFLVARLRTGELRAYLMEWKYVETGTEVDKGLGSQGDTRRSRYRALFDQVFTPNAVLNDYLIDPVYQLMRLSLLARKILDEGQLAGVTSARVVLVCPQTNEAYRTKRVSGLLQRRLGTTKVAEAMQAGLRDSRAFIDCAPAELVAAVRTLGTPSASRDAWLDYMNARYGW